MHEYTQGIMSDGPVILQDGPPMTPDQIVTKLNNYHHALNRVTSELESWSLTEGDLSTGTSNMKSAQEKAEYWLNDNVAGWCETQLRTLTTLLKEQDRDTRHACAEAVLQMDEPLDSSAAPSMAHDICINTRAV